MRTSGRLRTSKAISNGRRLPKVGAPCGRRSPACQNNDRLEVLVTLVEAYEAKHHPIPPPDPVEAILFRMDQLDLDRKDLEALIGSRARVSEVLSGRRRSLRPGR